MDRIGASERTRERLKALMEGGDSIVLRSCVRRRGPGNFIEGGGIFRLVERTSLLHVHAEDCRVEHGVRCRARSIRPKRWIAMAQRKEKNRVQISSGLLLLNPAQYQVESKAGTLLMDRHAKELGYKLDELAIPWCSRNAPVKFGAYPSSSSKASVSSPNRGNRQASPERHRWTHHAAPRLRHVAILPGDDRMRLRLGQVARHDAQD